MKLDKTFVQYINEKQAKDSAVSAVINSLKLDWENLDFTPEDLKKGYKVELEHGTVRKDTNITDDNVFMTLKIALAHLYESGVYYNDLAKMESGN